MSGGRPALVVERVGPGASVQDRGRPGWMHHGVPPGGALARELFDHTRRSLGNPDDSAAIELPLHGAVLRAVGDIAVSVDGAVTALRDGESLTVPAVERAVRYVALPGGVDVETELGGRGLLAVAKVGGGSGRWLRRGDVLTATEAAPATVTNAPWDEPLREVFALRMGPDVFDEAAVEALRGGVFTLSAVGDRVGVRVLGEGVRPDAREGTRGSSPMVRGAVQVTPDGTLVVLGPDHPTTGGYPVIAVLRRAEQGAFALLRPGANVRWRVEG